MSNPASSPRRRVGDIVRPVSFDTLSHGRFTLPATGLVHLQFRRFTGCPVCNLHLRSFARQKALLDAEAITTVAFFHSPADGMRPYQGDLPFPVVPDPERHHYRAFGVERSWRAILHPRVIAAALSGLFRAPSNPLAGGSAQGGLPADFLIDETGRILALHYGRHANDQWSVQEVLEKARRDRSPNAMSLPR
jgi:peroxiredoxin